jgi:NTE family protein
VTTAATAPLTAAGTAAAAGTEIPRRAWAVLAVCAGAAFVAFLDVTIVNIAFPAIRRSFGTATLADLSWVFNGYNVVFAALLVPAGRLADLLGRRRVFLAGMLLFAVASAGCGLAPTAWTLVAARVVQAVGAALLAPASLALLLPAFPPARRATAVALWGASGAVAAATGPALGGVLVEQAGWRWVFLVNLPLAAAVMVAGRRLLPEARDPQRGAVPDPLGVLLLALGVGAIALGTVKSSSWGWTDTRTLTALGAGALLLAGFGYRCARAAVPAVELGLFRVRSFAVANLAFLFFSAVFFALLLANILFLTDLWEYSTLRAGFAVTPGPLMAAASSAAAGRLVDRFGPRWVLVPAALVFGAGSLLFAVRLGDTPHYLTDFLPATLLTGAGVGATFAAMSAAVVAELPAARFATGSAISACLRQIGAALGLSLLLGHLTGEDGLAAYAQVYWVVAAGGAATAATAFGLGRARVHDTTVPAHGPPRPAAPATSLAGTAMHERCYRWSDPVATAEAARGSDGLALLHRMLRGELPPPPIAETLGFRLVTAEPGSVRFTGEPAAWQYNPIGSVHGGVLSTLLDSAAGCAVHSRLPAGTAYTSLDLTVRFLRPVTVATGTLTCTGEVVSLGRRTAFAQATLTDAAGKLVAHATSTCLLFAVDGSRS